MSREWDSNPRPLLYESNALPLSYPGCRSPTESMCLVRLNDKVKLGIPVIYIVKGTANKNKLLNFNPNSNRGAIIFY